MAINLFNKYGSRANPPSIDYPEGSIKNRSAPDVKDGTPLDADWANDHQGFFQSLLSSAGVVANGIADKVGASQYFDALNLVIKGQVPFATQAEFDAHTASDLVVSPLVMQPLFSGTATLTATDNKIVMSGIVTNLGLEVGDVIQITGAGAQNGKLRTVESITDASTIVVNYEHCGGRGNGSLKLEDYTGPVTIKRIAKWYNAAAGLGQDWVNVTPLRVVGISYPNSTGRLITVWQYATKTGSASSGLEVNGASMLNGFTDSTGNSKLMSVSAPISAGGSYSYANSLTTAMEMR